MDYYFLKYLYNAKQTALSYQANYKPNSNQHQTLKFNSSKEKYATP